MTATLVQSKTYLPGPGASINFPVEFDDPVTEGNLLVVMIATRSPSAPFSGPDGWDGGTTIDANGVNGGSGALFHRIADSTSPGPFTFGTSAGTQRRIMLAEFSGPNTLVDFVEVDSHSATTALTLGAVAPTDSSDTLLLAGVLNGAPISSISGYTSVSRGFVEGGINGPYSGLFFKAVDPASGTYNATTSQTSLGECASDHLAFSGVTTATDAEFSGTPTSGNAPLEVAFTDESTGTPASWDWDFGDGGTSTDQNPTHEYTDPGVYTVSLTVDDLATETKVGYIVVTSPGGTIDWSDELFEDVTPYIVKWVIQRGGGGLTDGGGYTGSGTLTLRNDANRFNPENTGGPLFGLLRDGPRVWVGVNKIDGTVAPDPGKVVKGLFAGRITDISLITEGGSAEGFPPFVELVCEDPLAWISRRPVTIDGSRHRSQLAMREAILAAANEPSYDLAAEPATMPLSYADGLAGNLLEDLNQASGTRHFARPADNPDDWYEYVTVRRTQKLTGVADAEIDAAADHFTGTSGWKTSADGVINQQKATVEPYHFSSAQTTVWRSEDVPFVAETRPEIWVEFDDFVDEPIVLINVSSGSASATLTPFGRTALIELTGAGTVGSVEVQGSLAKRGAAQSVVVNDETSQATSRGIRSGSEISGDFVGTLASAQGIAGHIVWRYADGKYRPDLTIENWFPEQFELDCYDLIAITSSHIGVTGRIFEIVGLTHYGNLAASPTAVHHVTTYQLMESRVQTPTTWFTLDQSLLDGADLLAY
jgi:PKD repeat protein